MSGHSREPFTLEPKMTLGEIADLMGMSRERVRQIEKRAIGKCKRALIKMGYNPEDFFSTLQYTAPIRHDPNAPESAYELMYDKEESND